MEFSQIDLWILAIILIISTLYLLQKHFAKKKSSNTPEAEDNLWLPSPVLQKAPKTAGPSLKIYFASQTGTAESYAFELGRRLMSFGRHSTIECMSILDLDTLESFTGSDLIFFIVSTYGEGEAPDSVKETAKLIFSGNPNLKFKYAVFGLGNSSYEFFNQFAKDLSCFLANADAQEIFELHLVDENLGIEKGYEEWLEKLFKHPDVLMDGDVRPTNFLASNQAVKIKYGKPTSALYFSASHKGIIKEIRKISKGERKIFKCEISSPEVQLSSGDHILLYPENNAADVLRLAKRLNVCELLDLEVELENTPKELKLKNPTTLRTILSRHLDISRPVSKKILKSLLRAAKAQHQILKLHSLLSDEAEYENFIEIPKRNIIEVLETFESLPMTIEDFVDCCPILKPRYYSVARINDNLVLTTVLVQYSTHSQLALREGVCSSWISRLNLSNTIFFETRNNEKFHMPADPTVPIIMIGPGTGIAPFIGFLAQRQQLIERGISLAPAILYFGCRTHEEYLYEDELQKYLNNGSLTKLYVAFSRISSKKTYVQHLMQENSLELCSILEEGGKVFVCGDGKKMAKDVYAVMQEILSSTLGLDKVESSKCLLKLRRDGRYCEDVW